MHAQRRGRARRAARAGGAARLTVPAKSPPNPLQLLEQLDARGRRTELLAALAKAGGLETERTANALRAELAALESSARAGGLDGLAALARSTREIVELLGGVKTVHWQRRDVIVLDDNEVTRDLVAIALGAEGHDVRAASRVAELAGMVRERKPHILITEVQMPDAPIERFCSYLRGAVKIDAIPIVVFSSAQGDELAALGRKAGADLWLSKDQGIEDLIGELKTLFEEILW